MSGIVEGDEEGEGSGNGTAKIPVMVICSGGKETAIEAPLDLSVSELLDELTRALDLPVDTSVGAKSCYRLESKALGRQLLPDETLESAQVSVGDRLLLTHAFLPRCDKHRKPSRISVQSSIGITLDALSEVDVRSIIDNETALMMTLHSYRATLSQLDDARKVVQEVEGEVRRLRGELKERNISTILFLLGQVQTGFGINLVTAAVPGGWLIFACGIVTSLGALEFSIGIIRRGG